LDPSTICRSYGAGRINPPEAGKQDCQDILFFIFITFLMKVMKNNPPRAKKNKLDTKFGVA
jgi:hypothetical protein